MRIVMIKGYSETGKTTIAAELIRELRSRGYSVGTVKDIHFKGFQADRPGTDTYKHMEAGAARVTARGFDKTTIITDRKMTTDEILKYYKEDFVILEGDCGVKCPTIITGATREDVDARMCPEAVAVSGVIAGVLQKEGITRYEGLPVIDGIKEVKKMADLVEKKTEEAKVELDVELSIGGEDIWMVPFVKETLKNVVIGAVKALDGYEEGKEIVIRVK